MPLVGALLGTLGFGTTAPAAEPIWGGSAGATTDYLVRGLSRSNHEPSLQAELHIASPQGWLAGLFTSTTRIAPSRRRDLEVGVFAGRAWNWNDEWSSKVQVSHYRYPLNSTGSGYEYNEVTGELSFRDWLAIAVVYAPDAPRWVRSKGLVTASVTAAEMSLQTPAWHNLSFNGGAGYSRYTGYEGKGFSYWSIGCSYDLSPVTLSAGFVDTGNAAQALFYENAAKSRWLAAVIWRF